MQPSTALNIVHVNTFSIFAECNLIAIPIMLDSNPQLGKLCCRYNRFCEHVTGTTLHNFRRCLPKGATALSLLQSLHKPLRSAAFDT
jgi:hypothetical protein